MALFSVKMRASEGVRHISGAERIVGAETAAAVASSLVSRAFGHSLGRPDFINVKLERVDESQIFRFPALGVSSQPQETVDGSFAAMKNLLAAEGLDEQAAAQIVENLKTLRPLRGAVLFDVAENAEVTPDKSRGIRVTYMDAAESSVTGGGKNHFREAVVLATKVANAPGIIAEICISDDPEYVTGYFASKKAGYVRLSPLKNVGDVHGGRIFLCDSCLAPIDATIAFLENARVLVENVPSKPADALSNDGSPIKKVSPLERLEKELSRLKNANLYRSLKTLTTAQDVTVKLSAESGESEKILLSSNNYLNLATEPRVKKAAAEAALQWGAGSGGSRLTTGNMKLHEELEKALAKFKGREAAILFNTGYAANVGIISALADENSLIFSDEYNHASIIDGCRLAKSKIIVYKHNDMDDLAAKIAAYPTENGFIVSDAVFSMDGDIVKLPQLVALGRKHGFLTMIDEAHATGVIGKTGRGTEEYFINHGYVADDVKPDILMGTLSKALGAEGGFAASSEIVINYLINKARSYIFSTSQAPATLAAALASLKIIENEPERVAKLQHNVEYFCSALTAAGIETKSETPIVPVFVGDEGKAMKAAAAVNEAGVMIPAIRYPTVAKNTARLRVALMAEHSEELLQFAAEVIAKALRNTA